MKRTYYIIRSKHFSDRVFWRGINDYVSVYELAEYYDRLYNGVMLEEWKVDVSSSTADADEIAQQISHRAPDRCEEVWYRRITAAARDWCERVNMERGFDAVRVAEGKPRREGGKMKVDVVWSFRQLRSEVREALIYEDGDVRRNGKTATNYHDCRRVYLGESDIAQLLIRACGADGVQAHTLGFGGDSSYDAYFVDDPAITIPDYYTLVIDVKPFADHGRGGWIQIYDDTEKTFSAWFGKICRVYRAGEYGCIIQCI